MIQPSENGFTLLEILFVLFIFALISSGIGLALLSNMQANMVAYYAESLHQSIVFARSYAFASNAFVTLCPSKQGTICNRNTYTSGWIVFAESDFTEIGELDDADTLLQVRATANTHVRINTNSYGDGLRLQSKGNRHTHRKICGVLGNAGHRRTGASHCIQRENTHCQGLRS